jgi:UDP-glucuronate decarboxylase
MNKKALTIIEEDVSKIAGQLKIDAKKLEGKTLLITGPNGLLAGYLVDTIAYLNDNYLKTPCKVIGLQLGGVKKNSRLGHLLGRTDMRFESHDVTVPYKPKGEVDFIIHAAGRSAPAFFQSDPLGTIDVNVKGIRWILDCCAKSKKLKGGGVKSVLYMSSGEIYGNPTPENVPTKETYAGNASTLAPRACYTSSKRLSETLCDVYFRNHNVPVKIARPFIVYGPGLSIEDRRVMADFMRKGIAGTPIKMLNEGLDSRAYCYITDATIMFFRLLLSDHNSDPFNIANNSEEITIRKLAETVHEICGIKKPVTVAKKANTSHIKDAPNRVCPDISKAKRLLNHTPEVTIREGLARTIKWNEAIYSKKVK